MSDGRPGSTLHVDLVKNEWAAGFQRLIERIDPADERAARDGDYLFASTPHTLADCPFRESECLPFEWEQLVKAKGV